MSRVQRPRRRRRQHSRATGVERWLRAMPGCTVIQGHARFEAPDVISVGDEQLRAPRIFINVGGRAVRSAVAGRRSRPYLDNSSMLALDRLPAHLVVVGGSYVGLEFAQMYRRFGAQVTVVEMKPRLIANEDDEVSEAIRGDPRRRRDRRPHRRGVHQARAARRRRRGVVDCSEGRAGGGRLRRPARRRTPPEHRRPRRSTAPAWPPTRAATSRSTTAWRRPCPASGRWATATAAAPSRTPRTTTSRLSPPTCSTASAARWAIAFSATRSTSIRRSAAWA